MASIALCFASSQPVGGELADALIYCDMTTGPDGQRMSVEQRLDEIRSRYAPDHPVSRALAHTAPELTRAVRRVQRRLARASSARNVLPAVRPLGAGSHLAQVRLSALLQVMVHA